MFSRFNCAHIKCIIFEKVKFSYVDAPHPRFLSFVKQKTKQNKTKQNQKKNRVALEQYIHKHLPKTNWTVKNFAVGERF